MPNTAPDGHRSAVHVAVAIIQNDAGQVLIARRPEHVHQGGFWEFPGGKVESGETVFQALHREIREELQIEIHSAEPFQRLLHHYGDKSVLLDVWRITGFSGEPQGAEGQPVMWRAVSDLDMNAFPAANRKIIAALSWPEYLMITGDFDSQQDFQNRFMCALQSGIRWVQLRCKSRCDAETYQQIVHIAANLCAQSGARLMLNSDPDMALSLRLGLHLNSHDLYRYHQRPVPVDCLFSVSCHHPDDLEQASRLQADFVLLSPVKATSSHPGVAGMGWENFASMTASVSLPVYALGGMTISDLPDARQSGAQGLAAISAFWRAM